ncbi:Short-chain dehydrogenase/reductase SDR [Penicillium canescens]|uniref:Short-chain dehydrogenase/reductase SDR n=1 Tax=Penicillium canescens TaxID=5083 RepID=A0AAD6I801_PENCN|nr:Short-chain dehydrogenase/reductase SDR [Penicillium canescens]KAJ6035457.1 Short-chain dehydrogenase/reductase SDR [Penicillium canescens]KAJ6037580.1 Short-chain dehydrogenase/reductase SDR [Penicillium canescens]KAJ6054207.1 Short-chain dehydrogenase/reductase SDR [Penicillium canescens]
MSFLFSKSHSFDPRKDISSLSGRVILVTGGNNGLGKETIKQLAAHNPTKIYMGARSIKKAEEAIIDIKREVSSAEIVFLDIDLASFASIKRAAETFLSTNDRLDILINNAGIFAAPPGLTEDGYEVQFGTNYMGSALLTRLLLPILTKTADTGADVRIVNISSELYRNAPKAGILLKQAKTPLTEISTVARYGHSKLANIYFARSCAKKFPSIKSVSLHPGLVRTNIGGGMTANPVLSFIFRLFSSVASVDVPTGTLNQLWASTADSAEVKNGAYYIPFFKEAKRAGIESDMDKAEELWQWTEREFKEHGF